MLLLALPTERHHDQVEGPVHDLRWGPGSVDEGLDFREIYPAVIGRSAVQEEAELTAGMWVHITESEQDTR